MEPHAPDVSQGSVAPDLQPPVAGAVAGGVPGSSSDAPVGAAQRPETSSRGPQTLRDPLAEALRLIELGDRRGIEIRIMGGLAFHALVRSWTARIDRDGRDMDLATRSRDRKAVQQLLAEEGYVPDRQYNALYGHKQLYFVDPEWNRPVDVLVDRLEMCHAFSFDERLAICDPTLPPADLLLSKLQVVKINRKDVLDALALLAEYPLAGDDVAGRAISVVRITDLTSSDWGWWRTLTGNLAKLTSFLVEDVRPGDLDFGRESRFDAAAQVEELRVAIDAAPKSTRWKMRSRLGDRVPWYQEPEEVGHGR